ncbi:MAG: regulatory protein NosR [Pseudohongiellaceae bacterium]
MTARRNFSTLVSIGLILSLAALAVPTLSLAQTASAVATPFSTDVQAAWLQEVFPDAGSFGPKQGEPPAWPAFGANASTGQRELIGYVFMSADVPPIEQGYSAPIDILVGVDKDYRLTGVKLLDYTETYRSTKGDFLARPLLLHQFPGKPIRDEFQIGRDIDGIAGSTVSVFAVARSARNAARQIAGTYLGYNPVDPVQQARIARIAEILDEYSWAEMLDNGLVRQLEVPLANDESLVFSFTYLGHPGLGEFWIGGDAYGTAERLASAYLAGSELMLVAVSGAASDQFRFDQLQVRQDNDRFLSWFRRVTDRSFVTTGTAGSARIAEHADSVGALVLPENIDLSRPFTLAYRQLGAEQRYEVEFELTGIAAQLARGEDLLSAAEIEAIERSANSWVNQLRNDPPWGVTPWGKLATLLVILTLAMAAFLGNDARLRWITLTATLIYLGFIDGGFISISHLTNTINQGPGFLFSNLPLLLFVIFTLVTTLLWGRVFCSSLCPFGALQDFITRFGPRRWRREINQSLHDKALYLKYLFLALIVGTALLAGNVTIFQYFEPFGTLFFVNGALILWVILLAILAACFVVPRFYCRYVCPLGAALGVVALVSPLRIKRVPQCTVCIVCERACPTGAIRREQIDFKECVRCDICEIKLLEQAGSCQHDMEHIIATSKASAFAAR